ncbi:MAG: transglutaminase-like domain-containing protein [Clostridiales bacterium]|nr:transglutaminase-like domain-containing protein [Clostridiales bacterium]
MMRIKKVLSALLVVGLITCAFSACGNTGQTQVNADDQQITIDLGGLPEGEMVPLADAPPAVPTMLLPVASGTDVKQNSKAVVDASNAKDGYVMIKYVGGGSSNIKVLLTGPDKITYTYNLRKDGSYEVFPLSGGNGAYSVGVYKNISGTQYSTEFTTNLSVSLKDVFAPFLMPNQYVNYNASTLAVKKASELTAGTTDVLKKVEKIYDYIVKNFTYDKQLAATVQSGYLPDLDSVWNKKSGICFDYAATVTAMLRSQKIPTQLVIGYTGQAYHAWISVYTAETGWVEGVIYFDGKTWKLMDPTFASSSNSSDSIMKYIGDGKNYSAKYLY